MVDVEQVLLERNVPIPLRDGTVTYANVWRPAAGDPVPAIMVRTPYTKEVEEINIFSEPRVAAVRGFAVVSQDVRGRGYSEGEFDPYFQEGPDGYDSIEHVAGLDWCSGDVVMAGNSYVGATQWLAAVEAPPSLRAIAPGLTPRGKGDRVKTDRKDAELLARCLIAGSLHPIVVPSMATMMSPSWTPACAAGPVGSTPST